MSENFWRHLYFWLYLLEDHLRKEKTKKISWRSFRRSCQISLCSSGKRLKVSSCPDVTRWRTSWPSTITTTTGRSWTLSTTLSSSTRPTSTTGNHRYVSQNLVNKGNFDLRLFKFGYEALQWWFINREGVVKKSGPVIRVLGMIKHNIEKEIMEF